VKCVGAAGCRQLYNAGYYRKWTYALYLTPRWKEYVRSYVILINGTSLAKIRPVSSEIWAAAGLKNDDVLREAYV